MLDRARSIDDPYYKGGLLHLWTVQYWDTMHNIEDDQKTWQKALQWLKQHDEDNSAKGEFLMNVGPYSHFSSGTQLRVYVFPRSRTSEGFSAIAGQQVSIWECH